MVDSTLVRGCACREIRELFDVAVIPGTACPMAIGTDLPDMRTMLSFDPEFGPLLPESRNA
ncbi:MAG TPA: hypothetical protein VGW34_03085 [Allosphingosinicella sp.]|nr:hypothetical protein [Allosphingosinicella sp.]